MDKETYLGDGLYAKYDGFQVWLRAPRGSIDHYVALDPYTLDSFFRFLERVGGAKITISKMEDIQDGNAKDDQRGD